MPGDFYVQPDAPDPVLPEAVVLGLARRYVPEVRAVTTVDESGGEARTYALDETLILKTQRPQQLRPRTSLSKEVFFLQQIAQDAPDLRVPRVLGHGEEELADGSRVEYTVMTRMPGVAMRHAQLDVSARQAVVRQVGMTLRRLHALPQQPFVESELLPGDHSFVDVQIRFGRYFGDLADEARYEHLPWSFELTPEQLGARALAALPPSRERVALHSNPYLEHVFVHPDTGTYSGLIDFGDAFISHPACDLRRWTRQADRDALLEGYTADGPVSDAFLVTWRVLGIVTNAMVMAYYAEEQPERAAQATEDLRALLASL
ncbi:MAG TPA: aminoglycoside phosphotransferase family protein [Ktedonobacterales bacterium]|nr:aminoglycoside phosphotransferase family protein [Ktedonobacterales bacterium]HEX5571767.1 aminoglycoside phosphotransferase family protein [Ktedonobacterales bacterium]